MKIGFILDDSLDSSDGVQQYILTLGRWLTGQGHEIHYLVGQSSRRDLANLHSLSRNLGVRFNGNRMSIPLPASRSAIRKLLNAEKFDILHVQMPYSPFMAGRVIKLAPADTIIVGTFHIMPYGMLQRWAARMLQLVLRPSSRRFSKVWSVSRPAQKFAASMGVKSTVLSNPVSLADFRPRIKRPKNTGQPFRVVFLGRLVERKGCLNLLRAVKLLIERNGWSEANLRVVIGGRGPEQARLLAWVHRNGLSKVVKFAGFIDETAKADFLAEADVAVFPSLGGESFGIVLLEAMAAGAGVVLAGNNPGYASVLGHVSGSLFNPSDPADIAARIDDIYRNPAELKRIHLAQRQLVKRYDVAEIGQKLVSYYKQLRVEK